VLTARLPRTYDPEPLRRDLDALRSIPKLPQAGPYHNGEWAGVALYEQGGALEPGPLDRLQPHRPTRALDLAPALARVLDDIPSPKLLVRLLTLPPGGRIGEHRDVGVGFAVGRLRLHVPVVTDPAVVMMIGAERTHWRPGELWWGDFSQPHWLRNDSAVTRTHLVADVEVNPALLRLLPLDLLFAHDGGPGGMTLHRPPLASVGEEDLVPFAGVFTLPAVVRPLLGHGARLTELARPARVELRPRGDRLVAHIDEEPVFAMYRLDARTFAVVGSPQGLLFCFDDERTPHQVQLVVRGLPRDLFAAQLGRLRGELVPEQRFPLAFHSLSKVEG